LPDEKQHAEANRRETVKTKGRKREGIHSPRDGSQQHRYRAAQRAHGRGKSDLVVGVLTINAEQARTPTIST